ncbi:hypothetical protein AVEN_251925-1 [Araneus ventricosus]|uniref:CCHC-type domain-containing protein n=1 Tax=Araneus ventricosus TaxID=182803 RepID=A0A4Y2H0H0_ARAVE|nr:hypothetical protein AVEN_251925-1 [Araneus ventricosus]
MGKSKKPPFSGRQCVQEASALNYFDKFFILNRKSSTNETFHSVSPFLVEKAISGYLGEIPSVRKLRSGDLLVEVSSQKQAQIIIKLNASIPVTVTPHASLNFSKGVVSCGELLNTSIEEIADKLKSQGVTHVWRISMRKGGQLLDTKHLVFTFHGSKIPESIKAGYMKLAVRHYFPNPLRCFKCQRFGHSKASCRGILTCARCAEAGHDSSDCKASEKCVNCKGSHTSFSRLYSAWKFEKEVIAEKVKNNLSYIEARRIVKSRTPTLGTSYATAAQKKLEATNSQILPSTFVPFKASYTPSEICPRSIDPVLKLFLTDTHKETVSSQFKNPPDFSDFKTVTNRKKLKKDSQVYMDNKTDNVSQNYKTPQLPDKEKVSRLKLGKNSSRQVSNSVIKTSHNDSTKSRVHSVDTELLPMPVLPPLETSGIGLP